MSLRLNSVKNPVLPVYSPYQDFNILVNPPITTKIKLRSWSSLVMTWASQAYNPGSNPGDRIGLYRIIIQNDRLAYKNTLYNVLHILVQISKAVHILTPIEENRPASNITTKQAITYTEKMYDHSFLTTVVCDFIFSLLLSSSNNPQCIILSTTVINRSMWSV